MPKFRYRVYDPKKGRVRRGTLKAETLKKAQDYLESRQLTVQSLKPEKSKLVFKTSKKSRLSKSVDLNYQPSFQERFRFLSTPGHGQTIFLFLLILLGSLLTYASWTGLGKSGQAKQQGPRKDISLEIQGALAQTMPKDVQVLLRLPEVPYEKTFQLSELLSGEEAFSLKLNLNSTRSPSYCQLMLSCEGYRPTFLSRVTLTGSPLSAKVTGVRLEKAESGY